MHPPRRLAFHFDSAMNRAILAFDRIAGYWQEGGRDSATLYRQRLRSFWLSAFRLGEPLLFCLRSNGRDAVCGFGSTENESNARLLSLVSSIVPATSRLP